MRKVINKTLTAASVFILLGLAHVGNGYRIAIVNDIHADVHYNPSAGACISKFVGPS